MGLLRQIFTWWGGTTIGTRLFTWRAGEEVGHDEYGNTYYRNDGDTRRWVIYSRVSEASLVLADWHGWLHHTFEKPPSEAPLRRWPWEKDHKPNMTGTPEAYRPPGSLLEKADRAPSAQKTYTPWVPE